MMQKIVFTVVLSSILFFEAQSQIADTPPNAQSGKCYAKCTTPESTPTNPILVWEEVLCGDKITSYIVRDIHSILKQKGYNVDGNAEVMTSKSKDALSKFQKTFNLPIGNLNIKTLEALGIRY